MTVQDTSLTAYYGLVLPKLTSRQESVLEAFQGHYSLTNAEVATLLGWEINHVTGRTKELRDEGLLEFVERRSCKVNQTLSNAYAIKRTPTKEHYF